MAKIQIRERKTKFTLIFLCERKFLNEINNNGMKNNLISRMQKK